MFFNQKKTQFDKALKSPKVLNSHIFLYVCLFQSVYYEQLTCLLVHNVHQKFLRDHKEFPASLAPALTLAAAPRTADSAVACYKGNTIGTRVWARETPFDGTLRTGARSISDVHLADSRAL